MGFWGVRHWTKKVNGKPWTLPFTETLKHPLSEILQVLLEISRVYGSFCFAGAGGESYRRGMNGVLSIDPGLHKCGCALWNDDGELLRAWTSRHQIRERAGPLVWRAASGAIDAPRPSVLVLEVMQVDGRTRGKERALLELSGVVGAIAARFWDSEVVSYTPRQWKKNLPKEVMQARLRGKLTIEEQARICPRATHDAWDAVGIGAFYFREKGVTRWQLQRKRTKTVLLS